MYKVKVVGTYVARSGIMDKEKIKKNYEIEGIIPTMTNALSVVKNKLLAAAIAKKYPDYVTYLTYHITEISPLTEKAKEDLGKIEIQYMGRGPLVAFIKEHALPVDPRFYPDLFKLREAVQLAKEDPKAYEKQFALRKEDLQLDLEMAKCNPELFNEQEPDQFIASVTPTVPKPKALPPATHERQSVDRMAAFAAQQKREGDLAEIDPEPNPEAGDL